MKALLVNGSPHKAGCTHTALQVVGDALRESGIEADDLWIGNKPIAGCIGCYKCVERGECVFGGDKVEEFLVWPAATTRSCSALRCTLRAWPVR